MKIQKTISESTMTIVLEGRLDTLSAPSLEEEIKNDIDSVNEVIMECENLDYTTSAGLRILLEIQQIMEDKDGVLKMRNVNEVIREILEFTGFLDFLVIE